MSRDVLVDRLKGYACFLVVIGHVIMGIRLAGIDVPSIFPAAETFIWSFHVSLFLFLSGQVYTLTGGWKGKQTRFNFIKHKAITLGVPYIIFSVVYILINSFAGGANNQSSYADILLIWKTPIAQYWFLYALFFLFVTWALLGKFKNWQITIFVVGIAYLVPLLGGTFGPLEVVMYSALPFGVGTCFKIATVDKGHPIAKIAVILLHIAVCAVLIKLGVMGMFGVKELIMFFGIYASILFISMLSKFGIVSRFLDFFNKYSFQTYLLHTIFTAGIRMVFIKMNVTHWGIHLVGGLLVGILCPVIVAKIAERIPVLNRCFFPLKPRKVDKND
ncbi:MAG: acyltransferase [Clostridia bacterium]|nr:acyltransferase [Clostridia bacterium]